jgi:hypothetical protein
MGSLAIAFLLHVAQRVVGLPMGYFVLALSAAVACYVAHLLLTRAYQIRRYGSYEKNEMPLATQALNLVTGDSVDPRWVGIFGLLGLCFLLAIPLEIMRWFLTIR